MSIIKGKSSTSAVNRIAWLVDARSYGLVRQTPFERTRLISIIGAASTLVYPCTTGTAISTNGWVQVPFEGQAAIDKER